MENKLIGRKFQIDEKIGEGCFGYVCKGHNTKTGEIVAIKIEKPEVLYKVLKHETSILTYLYQKGCSQLPKIYWYGLWQESTCLVMSYYTHSLHDFYDKKGALEPKKMDMLMIQIIDILEDIHKHYVLHFDIKPQNFMIKDGELYLIDFGFSKIYIDENGKHINQGSLYFTGSPKYVSYYNHCGEPASRRDDLISLGYMYLYLTGSVLPWENMDVLLETPLEENHIEHPKNKIRREYKRIENLEEIIEENRKIGEYLEYCYSLDYDENPEYYILRGIFTKEEETTKEN